MSAYTGIGSRETPADVLELMEQFAYAHCDGWDLRTGGAPGADSAFEYGCVSAGGGFGLELYLPWPGFNGHKDATLHAPLLEAFTIASKFHPAWDRLSRGAKALHARNVHQILGPDLREPQPSKFVLCWTPGAKRGGGTGSALRVAQHYGVPVFDLADPGARDRITTAPAFAHDHDWTTDAAQAASPASSSSSPVSGCGEG